MITLSAQATIEDAERKNDLSFMANLSKLGIQLGVVTIARTKIGKASNQSDILRIKCCNQYYHYYCIVSQRVWRR